MIVKWFSILQNKFQCIVPFDPYSAPMNYKGQLLFFFTSWMGKLGLSEAFCFIQNQTASQGVI